MGGRRILIIRRYGKTYSGSLVVVMKVWKQTLHRMFMAAAFCQSPGQSTVTSPGRSFRHSVLATVSRIYAPP